MLNNIDDLSEAVQKLQKAVAVLEQQKTEATLKLKKVETVLKQQKTEADARQAEMPDATDRKNAQAECERLERSLETFGVALKYLEMGTPKQQVKTYHSSTAKSGDSMKKILSDMLSEHRKISGAIGDMRKDIEYLRESQLKNRQTVTI